MSRAISSSAYRWAPPAGKWFEDAHRPVYEVRLGRQQRGRDPLAGKLAQRERRLERGDAAARNQNPERRRGGSGRTHRAEATVPRSLRQPGHPEVLLQKTT